MVPRLQLARATWGVLKAFDGHHASLADTFKAIAAVGYTAVEVPYKAVEMVRCCCERSVRGGLL